MKLTKGSLRKLIFEEGETGQAAHTQINPQYVATLDQVLPGLMQVSKELESAHQMAPASEAKATIAGLHNDLFQTTASFRAYIQKLKMGAQRKPS